MSMEIAEASKISWDVIVIGSGTGGGDAAVRTAQLGLKTLVIERSRLGGTCVNVGCVPTKMLIKIADHYNESLESDLYGVSYDSIRLDLNKVMKSKDNIIQQIIDWYKYNVFPSYDIKLVLGEGKIVGRNKVRVGEYILETRNIVVATGSKPKIPPIKGIDEGLKNKYVITSDEALNLREAPQELLTIGGGAIGIELSTLWSKFGSRIVIVELLDRLLPTMDPELGNGLEKLLRNRGFKIYTSTSVKKIDAKEEKVYLSNGEILTPDRVLLSVGREPVIDSLGLENVGVKFDRGGVYTDDRMRTNIPNIYAVGDVTGKYMLASVAKNQAIVAAENIAGLDSRIDYSLIPIGIFSDPEIGSVGIVASKKDPEYIVAKFPNAVNFRAIAYWKPYGFTKIVLDRKDGRLIGFHMIGLYATEMVNLAALAIRKRLTLDEARDLIFTHPVMSETFIDAFHLAEGWSLYLPRREK